jgi:hypothetical protein
MEDGTHFLGELVVLLAQLGEQRKKYYRAPPYKRSDLMNS